jgi:alkylation response protein AidB-like acyl-CoA dehydrogenase
LTTVHFELTDDQAALQEGMRNFCAGRFDMTSVRAFEQRFDRDAWRDLAEMGVFSLRLPEKGGGIDLGWADAVLAFEELGRALVPGPLVWTHLAAGLVDGAASGDVVVGGLDRDDAVLLEHPDAVDQILIIDRDGVWLAPSSDVRVEPVANPLDPLTPVAEIVGALPQGERLLDADGAHALWVQGGTLVSAFLLGMAEATTDLAVAYAKERTQFDKPIGAFQAVKHLLADMFTRAEVARGAVYAAGVTLDDPGVGSVERAVAAAKLSATDAAVGNGKSCIQVHGGMGYTWEVDAHLYFKRAYVLETAFGSPEVCADVMADQLEASLA